MKQNVIQMSPEDMEAPAVFSPDRRYRYVLRRKISLDPGRCLFIMLNPSTADESANDPTVTRCIGYARAWAYGTLEVGNIFALRSTNPKALYVEGAAPVGIVNDLWIATLAQQADMVVAAWGNHGALHGRSVEVLAYLRESGVRPMALGHTGLGQPKHPLYVAHDVELVSA